MMVSLGIYVRRWRRVLRRWLLDPRVHAMAQCVGYLLGGFALSAASLLNFCQPLALGALCASAGWPSVLLALGSMAGYWIFWGNAGLQGVVWLMFGLLAAATLGGREIVRHMPLLMSALAGLIVAGTGLLFQIWWRDDVPVALYLLRVGMAMLSTGLFSVAAQRRDPVVDWAVCALGILALAQISITPYVGLGYIAAAMLCCVGAFPAAALAGLALDLAQVTPVPMTAVMSLAYFVRLLPKMAPKAAFLAPAAVYMAVMALCGKWDLYPVVGLAIGGAAGLLIPAKTALPSRRGETGVAQVRLEMASEVMSQTGVLLQNVEEAPVDEAALVKRAAERACGNCPHRKNCPEEPAALSPEILHKPLVSGQSLDIGCRKSGRLLQELRRSQEHLRTIRADRDRRLEYRWAVVQQYEFMAEYLQDVADSLAKRKDPPRQWYQPEVAVCTASRESVNGDRCYWFAGVECRYYILLCDGMGTGEEAAREGRIAGNMLRKLLAAGYPPEYALRTVNSLCALRGKAGVVTIDLAELRLDTGKAVIYKWGAPPSYLISRGEPVKIGTATPPPGLSVTDCRETVARLSLRRGETLVLLSDGASGEEQVHLCWERAGEPVSEFAARILESGSAGRSDDATVAVVRLRSTPAMPS